jgi:arabinose-5-phosphate isomerase
LVGRKIAATLASLGTTSSFLHPAEALHGDLGALRPGDVVVMLSNSGETAEVVRLLPHLKRIGAVIVAATASRGSTLGRTAEACLELGRLDEACPLGLAPTSSTAAMLGLGDALAVAVAEGRRFGREDFARNHPSGALGLRLTVVDELMRPLEACRVANDRHSVRRAFAETRRSERRSGALLLVDDAGRLTGIYTDSDLARLIEDRDDVALDRAVAEVMTRGPRRLRRGARAEEALALLAEHKISELPIVDERGAPVGMIDVTDLVALAPELAAGRTAEGSERSATAVRGRAA